MEVIDVKVGALVNVWVPAQMFEVVVPKAKEKVAAEPTKEPEPDI